MRVYRAESASAERIAFGIELAIGLAHFPETQTLVASLEQANASLESASCARERAERAQLPARVEIRFADADVDQLLRSTWSACQIADGGGRGAVTLGLFPDGLKATVVPSGASQLTATRQFVTRAKACTVKGAEKVLGEWLPQIEKALTVLAGSLLERERLGAARAAAFAAEQSARQDHALAVDKLAGEVRALYPRDRARWDLIFPAVASSRRRGEAEGEVLDGEL